MSRYPNAPGRADLETSLLAKDIIDSILGSLDTRLLGIVVNGRVPSTAISGQVGPSQGGTGNALGQTTPLDGSVTDIKVALDANIDPNKLNLDTLWELVQDMLLDFLSPGTMINLDYNDMANTLTFSVDTAELEAFIASHLPSVETFGVVFNSEGDVVLTDADKIVTKRY